MTSEIDNTKKVSQSLPCTSFLAFAFVWIVGVALSLTTLRLAVSGKLWALGFPFWLITLIVLVGVWQWIWLGPALFLVRADRDRALYAGLLRGGISFSVLQIAVWLVLFLMFRHVSLQ